MLSEMSDDLSVKLYFIMVWLDMVNMELTCQNLIMLTMWLKKQPQELLGPLPSFF
jgi:hypothetical protein